MTTTPNRPPRAPRLLRWYAALFSLLTGWRVDSGDAHRYPSYIVVGAHHTSNWDILHAFLLMGAADIKLHYLAKDSLFKNPLVGALLRYTGGIPIDRAASHNIVDLMAERLRREPFVLGVSPEGTRKKTDYWRTGFYWMAVEAGVPILMATVHYPTRQAIISEAFFPTGDIHADMDHFRAFFGDKVPRIPANAGAMVLRPPKAEPVQEG